MNGDIKVTVNEDGTLSVQANNVEVKEDLVIEEGMQLEISGNLTIAENKTITINESASLKVTGELPDTNFKIEGEGTVILANKDDSVNGKNLLKAFRAGAENVVLNEDATLNDALTIGNTSVLTVDNDQTLTINNEVNMSPAVIAMLSAREASTAKIENNGQVIVSAKGKLNCPVTGNGEVYFEDVDVTKEVATSQAQMAKYYNADKSILKEGCYIDLGGYFTEESMENVEFLTLGYVNYFRKVEELNSGKCSLSIGNNKFINVTVWKIDEETHHLKVALPWLMSATDGFEAIVEFGNYSFTVLVADDNDIEYDDLAVVSAGICGGNSENAKVEWDEESEEITYKAKKYNIAYGLKLQGVKYGEDADQKVDLDYDGIIYSVNNENGSMGITKKEGEYNYTAYPFEWNSGDDTEVKDDDVTKEERDFTLIIPGKGSVDVYGSFNLVTELEEE